MKKVALSFPSYDLLWSFKEQTQAIHITVKPKQNIISGLFQQQEIELATKQFNASTATQQ